MQTERDFLGDSFITYKCSRCRKDIISMKMSLGTRTCPRCSNPEEIKPPQPEDILASLEHRKENSNGNG